MPKSFTQRLFLGVFLSQFILTIILFGAILYIVEHAYTQQFVDRVRSSSGLFASQLPAVDSPNYEKIMSSSLEELLFDGLAIYVKVNMSGLESLQSDFNIENAIFIEDFNFGEHNDSIYYLEIPIGDIRSNQRGVLQIGYDERYVEDQITSAYTRGAYLVAAYLFFSFLVVYTVAKLLTKPLQKIQNAAKKIAAGNNDETLSIGSNVTEIKSLAEDLELMRSVLFNQKLHIEDREKYISSIMDNMANAVLVSDVDNYITSINASAAALFGCVASDIVGKSIKTFFSVETWDWYVDLRLQLLGGAVTTGETHEWYGVRLDQSYFPIEVRMGFIQTAESHLCILNVSDISQRKLEQAEMIKAQETAQSANVAKTVFLSSMSHELRTPLNAIIGYSELIMDDCENLSSDQVVRDVGHIWSSGKHLLRLINDVLDLSKVEAGKMEFEYDWVDLDQFVSQIDTVTQPLMSKNNNHFTCNLHGASAMEIDELKLKQIILNLLSNAAKFTKNGNVILNVNEEPMFGMDWITMKITDDGIGMTPDQVEKVFDMFEQANSSITKQFGGTGLGLAITKKLVEHMGGKISIESRIGKGTTFTVELPKIQDCSSDQFSQSPMTKVSNH